MNALELAKVGEEAGLPPGVFNVVVGGAGVGEELCTHPGVDMIGFTGRRRPADASAKYRQQR